MNTPKPGDKVLIQINDAALWARVTVTAPPLNGTQRICIKPIEPANSKPRTVTLDQTHTKILFSK